MDGVDVFLPALVIGIVTLLISMAGVKLGSLVGDRYSSKAEILGGIILILLGIKILLEHSGVL
jgi:putative Mn2+ efflux pump MntP